MYFNPSQYVEEYNSYKYQCEDKTFSIKYLKPFFEFIQSNIFSNIHPNVITISSVVTIFVTFLLKKIIPGFFGNLLFSFGIIYYLIADSIDGIHARKINKTSVIGEYLDHIGDAVITGFIGQEILNCTFDDFIIQKKLMVIFSLYFAKMHFDSIQQKKIIFNYYDDVIAVLFSFSIINMFKFDFTKFTEFILNNINHLRKIINVDIFNFMLYSVFPLSFYMNTLTNILGDKASQDHYSLNKTDAINTYIFYIYYFLKLLMIVFCDINSLLSINLLDSYMILNLINSKIFQIPIDYKVIILLIFYYFSPLIVSILTVIYTYYLILKISKLLNIIVV